MSQVTDPFQQSSWSIIDLIDAVGVSLFFTSERSELVEDVDSYCQYDGQRDIHMHDTARLERLNLIVKLSTITSNSFACRNKTIEL
ncbi:hypothetical protein RRG08_036255 [Elysia crispata]|uniref:Uncharacterized protein n=1 Tax=Elysia crispata TaxID=231223 RepID=A0AAE0YXP7_9GAST|nr:hypothetical protein RRG08_036255 [Elysia crispata]